MSRGQHYIVHSLEQTEHSQYHGRQAHAGENDSALDDALAWAGHGHDLTDRSDDADEGQDDEEEPSCLTTKSMAKCNKDGDG